MRSLSSTAGYFGSGETPGEAGDFTAPSNKSVIQNLIQQANTVPLVTIFKHYGIRLNEHNKKTTCPFRSHKNGRENTPSFYFYPDTNSFRCFGCGIGHKHAHGCEFVSAMDGTTKPTAARKIIELFGSFVDEDLIIETENFSEHLEIMMDFSNTVRVFRQTHSTEHSTLFIEQVCSIYDRLYAKHSNPAKNQSLSNEALRRIVEQLKEKINSYTPCLTLSF